MLSLLFSAACTSEGPSALRNSLRDAVQEKRLSADKMEKILQEYEALREKDPEKAREYVLRIVSAIEMGGDSSHIDVVRKQVQPRGDKMKSKGA